jgi:tellurite resistance protein
MLSLKPGELPDITRSTATLEKLSRLAEKTCQELDAFSRWVGRTGEPQSLAGVALLPEPLARSRGGSAAEEFSNWLDRILESSGIAVVPSEQLLEHWPREKANSISRREQETLSRFLASRQVGYEPDLSQGGPSLAKTKWVALFRFPGFSIDPLGPSFQAATLLLHLAAVVASSDGEISSSEEQLLAEHLEHGLTLSPFERIRLQAHLRWLLAEPPKLTGIKKRVEALQEGQRRLLGAFLITVAGADGHLAPGELDALTKIYTLLGLEPQSVFAEVHQLMSSEVPAAERPVPVWLAGSPPSKFAIPTAPAPLAETTRGVRLDPSKVQAKLAETERVAEILGDIFLDDEPGVPSAERTPPILVDDFAVAGLDAAHSALLLRLAGQPIWQRGSVERLTFALGLMPEGALEVINEAAFTACDAPLFEGDETIEIDVEVLRRMLS